MADYQQNIAAMTQNLGNIANIIRQNQFKKLGQAFLQQGDYSVEGIKNFAQKNNLTPDIMSGVVQTVAPIIDMQRQQERDALKKQYYQDDLQQQKQRDLFRQKAYQDDQTWRQKEFDLNQSRLQQNDLATQQKAQQQQERDVRKTLSGQYELIRKSIVGNDSADFMLDYDENGNPVASQGDFDKLLNIRNSGGPKANQAAKALNIYSRLTGIEIPPPPEPEKEYSLMDSFNRGVDQGLENVRTGQVEGAGGGQLTSDIAAQYLQKAGGDRAKAEKMAKADGFTW